MEQPEQQQPKQIEPISQEAFVVQRWPDGKVTLALNPEYTPEEIAEF